MKISDQIKLRIKTLISNNKLEESIELIESQETTSDLRKNIILIKRQYKDLNNNYNKGIINHEEVNLEKNRIANSLLNFLDMKDDIKGNQPKSNIAQVILAVCAILTLLFSVYLYQTKNLKIAELKNETINTITIQGVVLEEKTRKYIQGAEVSILNLPLLQNELTDSKGRFYLEIDLKKDYNSLKIQVIKENYVIWNQYFKPLNTITFPEILLKKEVELEKNPRTRNINRQIERLKGTKISGIVQNAKGMGLNNVEVFIVGSTEKVITMNNGTFMFNLGSNIEDIIQLKAEKEGYSVWREYISIPRNDLIIQLKKE